MYRDSSLALRMTRSAGRGYVIIMVIKHSLRSTGRFLGSLSLASWKEGFIAACASARNDKGGGWLQRHAAALPADW